MSIDDFNEKACFQKALNYSFLLLKYRARSREEIKDRLRRKDFSPAVIEKVINYLQGYKYIDDREFTCSFVSASIEKGWGHKKIYFALKKLGVSQDLREEFLKDRSVYKDKIREIIEKRIHRYKDKKNVLSRIVRYMLSRGFDYAEIIEPMREMEDRIPKTENR
jgi:regulatory protein